MNRRLYLTVLKKSSCRFKAPLMEINFKSPNRNNKPILAKVDIFRHIWMQIILGIIRNMAIRSSDKNE